MFVISFLIDVGIQRLLPDVIGGAHEPASPVRTSDIEQYAQTLNQDTKASSESKHRWIKWMTEYQLSYADIWGELSCFNVVYKVELILPVEIQGLRTHFMFHLLIWLEEEHKADFRLCFYICMKHFNASILIMIETQ